MPRIRNHVVRDVLPGCRGGAHRTSRSGQRQGQQRLVEDALNEYLDEHSDGSEQSTSSVASMESEKCKLRIRDQ